jgi:hypothetical protein
MMGVVTVKRTRVPGEHQDWASTRLIRTELNRGLLAGGDANIVIADRATGKTTALAQVVAMRRYSLDPEVEIGVVAPTAQIAEHFLLVFQEHFPKTEPPIVASAENALRTWRGVNFGEVFVEEPLLMPYHVYCDLSKLLPIVMGVSTISRPMSVTISSW